MNLLFAAGYVLVLITFVLLVVGTALAVLDLFIDD